MSGERPGHKTNAVIIIACSKTRTAYLMLLIWAALSRRSSDAFRQPTPTPIPIPAPSPQPPAHSTVRKPLVTPGFSQRWFLTYGARRAASTVQVQYIHRCQDLKTIWSGIVRAVTGENRIVRLRLPLHASLHDIGWPVKISTQRIGSCGPLRSPHTHVRVSRSYKRHQPP